MKYVNTVSQEAALTTESVMGQMLKFHLDMQTHSFDHVLDNFVELPFEQRETVLVTFKPIFRLGAAFSSVDQNNKIWHPDLISAIRSYLETHSVPLINATELGSVHKSALNLAKELGLDPEMTLVYYGNKDDFKTFFLNSDMLKDAGLHIGFESNVDFFCSPMYTHAYVNLDLYNYFHDVVVSNEDDGVFQFHFPDGNPEADDNALVMVESELQAFVSKPTWEHVWDFLRFTHCIVEMGGFTLLTTRELPYVISDLQDYIIALEAVDPMPMIAEDIDGEREKYIFLLRHMDNSVKYHSSRMRSTLMSHHVTVLLSRIEKLDQQIIDLSSKPIREVVNTHGW
jgi:hypothetical protein